MGEVVPLFPLQDEVSDAFEKWAAMARECATNPARLRDAGFMTRLDEANREWRKNYGRMARRRHDA